MICVAGLFCRNDRTHPVSAPLTTWDRPRFEAGGGDAFLFFVLYGEFAAAEKVSRVEYRTDGWPAGVEVQRVRRDGQGLLPFHTGEMARVARADNPEAFAQAQDAQECLVVQGTVRDPSTLNYLRDVIGMIAWWFDHGAIAALDTLRFKFYDPVEWWLDLFAPLPPRLLNHLVLLGSSSSGGPGLRTRGFRKFGRPDLLLRGFDSELEGAMVEMFQRMILFQAEGGVIQEGQAISFAGLPDGFTCHHGGKLEDPEFNNVHVEIRRPGTYSF